MNYIFLFIFYLKKRVIAKELPRAANKLPIVVSKPYMLLSLINKLILFVITASNE